MNPASKMEGTRKIAILLLSLDSGLAAEVLAHLPREKVEQITLAIANAERVTQEQQESVLNDFKTAFVSRPLMQPSGPDTARELLERTFDQTEVEPIQQRLEERVQAGPFAFLHSRHPDDIRLLIKEEHPQTIALIASQLPPSLAAQVLAGFDAATQAEILGRLARLGPTDIEILSEVATLLQHRIGRIPVRTGGINQAAGVLQESTRTTAREVLRSLDRKDSHLAEAMRESLFSFQDLTLLHEETLKVVLRETSDCQWAVALKGCTEVLRQRVVGCLPKNLAIAFNDEMNAVGPLRLSEISAVQHRIADSILNLEAEGQIELPRKGLNSTAANGSVRNSPTTPQSVKSVWP